MILENVRHFSKNSRCLLVVTLIRFIHLGMTLPVVLASVKAIKRVIELTSASVGRITNTTTAVASADRERRLLPRLTQMLLQYLVEIQAAVARWEEYLFHWEPSSYLSTRCLIFLHNAFLFQIELIACFNF